MYMDGSFRCSFPFGRSGTSIAPHGKREWETFAAIYISSAAR